VTVSPACFRNVRILTGPTGSGKSAFAARLAQRWNAEIVAMDSMTLYRYMDIGTAKPSLEERAQTPHHLIDVLEPWETANVAWWLEKAAAAVSDIEGRGRIALFVGGTPLYLKALLCGLFAGPARSPEIRARLEAIAVHDGVETLHRQLVAVDPTTGARLHPNDVRRVVRALEVFELTGRPISHWQTEWSDEASKHTPLAWWLDWPRSVLNTRLDDRVEKMIAAGWIDEATRLLALGRPLSREAKQALGYVEIIEHLRGERSLPETIALIQLRTRQFAKRQVTWFKQLPQCIRVPMQNEGELSLDVFDAAVSTHRTNNL